MLKNYFRIAWRNVVRHKGYAAINIAGLAVGIAACLMLFTVVKYELSYDTFQPNYKRIYHVAREIKNSEGTLWGEGVPFPMYDALKLRFPQAITGAMFENYNSQVSVLNPKDANALPEKKFIEETGCFFSDPDFFSVFQFKWLYGSPQVLKNPDMAILTKKMAEKYYGKWESAIGGLLKLDNTATVKVAGIIDDLPANTDFPVSVVTSYETMKEYPNVYGYNNSFGNVTSNFQAYMLLPQNLSPEAINKQMIPFSDEAYGYNTKANNHITHFLRPLSDLHFDKRFGTFGDHTTSKTTLWTLSLIGLFIIIMASINFINLSTAQSVGRSKEVGIRKVLGSNRTQLFWQMMGETAIVVFASILLGLGIATICTPYLGSIASIHEKLSLFNSSIFIFLSLLAIVVTVLAGTYPSLVLSGFKPALALKNKITSATVGGISLRRGLVVTQFAISQILIIGTIIAVSQMNFVRTADLGFNKNAVLVLNSNVDSSVNLRQPAFKQKLLAINGVQSVSFSSDIPSSESNNSGSFSYDHRPQEKFELYRKFADEDYFKTYGLQIIAGRSFDKSDTVKEVVVNETLLNKLGIQNAESALGHDIQIGKTSDRTIWGTIVGVVKDFKTNSLREAIKPLAIAERNKRYYYTGIKLDANNLTQTITSIEKTWNEFFPEYVYKPAYLDDTIKEFYTEENQLSLLYKIFAGIAIFISCLGLYGLVSFMAIQRTKEVGIRKVLGASVGNIVYLFSKEFTILIVIAFALAVPVAYYMMSSWLNNFVYRIKMATWIFLLAIMASVFIAWITVGYKSLRAALANPVKSLRSE